MKKVEKNIQDLFLKATGIMINVKIVDETKKNKDKKEKRKLKN